MRQHDDKFRRTKILKIKRFKKKKKPGRVSVSSFLNDLPFGQLYRQFSSHRFKISKCPWRKQRC